MRSWLRWLVLAVIVAGIGTFYGFGWHEHFSFTNVRSRIGDLQSEVDNHLVLAALIFFALYAIMTALSVPAAWILTVVAGALFGRVFGAAIALLAATVGATLAFLSSRFL